MANLEKWINKLLLTYEMNLNERRDGKWQKKRKKKQFPLPTKSQEINKKKHVNLQKIKKETITDLQYEPKTKKEMKEAKNVNTYDEPWKIKKEIITDLQDEFKWRKITYLDLMIPRGIFFGDPLEPLTRGSETMTKKKVSGSLWMNFIS